MDCLQIEDPYIVNASLQSGEETTESRILLCYYKLYYDVWTKFVHKNFPYLPESRREELINYTFNDALLGFVLFIRIKGYENNGATIKTVFFAFCKRKLFKMLRSKKTVEIVGDDISDVKNIKQFTGNYDSQSLKDEEEIAMEQERIFSAAWVQLGERCKKLIVWRKLKRWDDKKIAERLDMREGNVTNEVYRCSERLRTMVENLKTN